MGAAFVFVVVAGWVFLDLWIDPKTATDRTAMATAFAGIIGGSLLLLGAWNAYKTLENSRVSLDLTRETQYAERYSRAVEQLGADQSGIRVGAIYALEALSRQAPSHNQQCIDVLTHFVRSSLLPYPSRDSDLEISVGIVKHREDVQIAINVLGRRELPPRSFQSKPLDLSGLNLSGYSFRSGKFDGCDFSNSRLTGCDFRAALLRGTRFSFCECSSVHFDGAALDNADLQYVSLGEATFFNPRDRPTDDNSDELQRFVSSLTALDFLKQDNPALYRAFKQGAQGNRMVNTSFKHASEMRLASLSNTDLSGASDLEADQLTSRVWDSTTHFPAEIERIRSEMRFMDRNLHA